MDTNRPSETRLLPGDGRGKDLSGHGKKSTKWGTLTYWRETAEGTCQDTERNRPSEGCGHSHTGGRKEKCKAVHGNHV